MTLKSIEKAKKFLSKLSPSDLREAEVMKYWSLPAGSSANQKLKLQKCIQSSDYVAAIKRDGSGYKYLKDENGKESLTSRTTSKKTGLAVDKIENFPAISKSFENLPNGTCFAGEICFPDRKTNSAEITKITGALPLKAIARQKDNPVVYYIFDILAWDGIVLDQVPAYLRYEIIKEIAETMNFNNNIEFINPISENLEEFIAEALSNGEEGVVMLHKNSPYYFKRTPAWQSIKVKKSLNEGIDLVIMGTTPPNKEYTGSYPHSWKLWENIVTGEMEYGVFYDSGKHRAVSQFYFEGKIGGFRLGAYQGDKLIEVCKIASISDEIRNDATDNPEKYIGRVVEIDAMEVLYKTRGIRHPRFVKFRDDKIAEDCTIDLIF